MIRNIPHLLFASFLGLSLLASGQAVEPIGDDIGALQQRGSERFFAGQITESLADWDRVIELDPRQGPYHWQRGIALYYADRYEDGGAQFESHQKVNRNDVENAAWHFICVIKTEDGSVEAARKKLIPIAGDTRVPMKEVHQLFAGTITPDAVLTAAGKGAEGLELRSQLCYAHLYLGLYFEAIGEPEKSAIHIKKAAVGYKMDHYMGRVAQVHHMLRSMEKDE